MSAFDGDTAMLPEDGFLRGRYRIIKLLGSGGMGDVWLAWDEQLNQQVALKTLKPKPHLNVDDLKKEILTARKVAAETVCRIFHFYDKEDRSPAFIEMEYVEGEDLQNRLHHPGVVFEELKAIELALDLCDGLDAIHKKGIVHSDLKPANIMVTPNGGAKIMDLGIAKQAGELIGGKTRQYAPPELLKGDIFQAQVTSDIYALGVVLYMLFNGGRYPFLAEGENSWPSTSNLIVRQQEWDGQGLGKEIHSSLRDIINGCLEPDAGKRTQSVELVRLALVKSKNRFDLWKPKAGEHPPDHPGLALIKLVEEDAMGSTWLSRDEVNGLQYVQFFSNDRGHREIGASHERAIKLRKLSEAGQTDMARLPRGLLENDKVPYFISWETQPGWVPLPQWVDENPQSNFRDHQRIIEETAAALEALHQAKIVHGELRPEVILVQREPGELRIRLRDPGRRLMRFSDRNRSSFSLPGEDYRAPELQTEEPSQDLFLDPRLDVYSLGAIFYRLWEKNFNAPIKEWTNLPPGPFTKRLAEMLSKDPTGRPKDGPNLRLILQASRMAHTETESEIQQAREEAEEQKRRQEEERDRRKAAEVAAQEKAEEAKKAKDSEAEQRGRRQGAESRSQALLVTIVAGSIILGALAILMILYENGRREKLAVQQTAQMVEDLLRLSNPDEGLGELLTARRMIDQAVRRVEEDDDLRGSVKAVFFHQAGITYQGLGLDVRAKDTLLKTQRLWEDEIESRVFWQSVEPTRQLISTLAYLARSVLAVDGPASTQLPLNEAKKLASTVELGEEQVLLRQVEAEILEASGDHSQAEAKKRENLTYRRKLAEQLSENSSEGTRQDADIGLGESLNDLAVNLYFQGRSSEAKELIEEAELIQKRYPESYRLLTVPFNHGFILKELRDSDGAKGKFESAAELARSVWGDNHPKLADSLTGLGWVYDSLGDLSETEAYFRETLSIRHHNWGDSHPHVARAKQTLAYTLIRRGKFDEATASLEDVLQTLNASESPRDPAVMEAKRDLAWALTYPDPGRAESIHNELLSVWTDQDPLKHATAQSDYADLLMVQARYDQARIRYQTALELRKAAHGDTPDFSIGRASERLGDLELKAEAPSEALIYFSAALGQYEKLSGAESLDVARVRSKYGLALAKNGEHEQARQEIDRARGIFASLRQDGHWEASLAKAVDAQVLRAAGDNEAARQMLKEAQGELESRLGPEAPETLEAGELLRDVRTHSENGHHS